MLVRDIGKTNCLTEIPQDIDLRFKEFVQPVLTENGTMGGDSFACDQSNYYTESSGDEQKAWYVFDGKFNGQEWQVNGVKLDTWYWLSWYNSKPIKISKVGVTNAAGQYSILAWKLQGSNNNSTWTDLTTGTNENVSSVTTWYMEIPEEKQSFYKYYRIYCQPRVTTALMIRELTLTAVESTIVLKAGSKVYPAYGTLDNSDTTTSDITATNTSNGQYMVIRSGLTAMYLANINSCLSGAVANRPASLSTNTGLYFATDENKMYLTGNGGVDWYSGSDYSLPLAIVTVSNGAISSIDQVFNGFGFIGSTLFALPGVKGFNPNGFENGAYANRERILGNVAIYTNTSYVSEAAFGFYGNAIARWSGGYEEVNELSDVTNPVGLRRYYVKSENKIYNWTGSAWAQEGFVFAGYLTMDSTAPYNITSLTVNPIRTKNDHKYYVLTKGDKKYLFARSKKKYYKYIYENWTQPVATDLITKIDGGDMVISASATRSGFQAWWAMDNEMPTLNKGGWQPATTPASWSVKFPYKIKITAIKFYNVYLSEHKRSVTGRFYTSSDMKTPIGDEFTTPNENSAETIVSNIGDGVITDELFFNKSAAGSIYGGIGEIKITAQKQVVVEGSVEDYDYTEYEELKFY